MSQINQTNQTNHTEEDALSPGYSITITACMLWPGMSHRYEKVPVRAGVN
jgi:hypothetical protein